LRADTQGTLEAIKSSLANLVSESVEATYALRFLHSSTGDVSESDVMLAQSASGLILAFNVRVPAAVEEYAKSSKVACKSYKTIYDLIDDARDLLEGTAVEEESKIKGRAQVLKLFKLPSGDVIAGSRVLAGAIKVGSRVAIYDKDPSDITELDEPLYIGHVRKLKKGKNDEKLVGKDVECGVLLKPQFEDISPDMYIEVL
jgi:translation initiation factor IF-2